jgi:diadenosine tetraphosphate (Ap4A) HIT family hydrolase
MTDTGIGGVSAGCPICAWAPDNPDHLFLFETPLWRVVLAPNQALLGRCIVHLKRHAGDLADLTSGELLEWLSVVRTLETALRDAFGATLFNWSCYMNLSYRDEHPNPHIHWWAVPRYRHPVTLGGFTFEDPHFGSPYDHARRLELPPAAHRQIAAQIQRALTTHSAT